MNSQSNKKVRCTEVIFDKLKDEFKLINDSFEKKFNLYEMISDATFKSNYEVYSKNEELTYILIEKAEYDQMSKKLNTEKNDLVNKSLCSSHI